MRETAPKTGRNLTLFEHANAKRFWQAEPQFQTCTVTVACHDDFSALKATHCENSLYASWHTRNTLPFTARTFPSMNRSRSRTTPAANTTILDT